MIRNIVRKLYRICVKLNTYSNHARSYFFYRFLFAKFGGKSLIIDPIMINNAHCMYIGSRVLIRNGARLEVVLGLLSNLPKLTIGDNVNIEQNVHIICGSQVVIEDRVSITGNCAIVDVYHPYENVEDEKKIGARLAVNKKGVHIGENCFIGYNAIILPGTHLGKNVIVGSHSVVSGDIPDFSVVAGVPAKIIKQYDEQSKQWVKVS